jgi:putative hemolysin
MKQRLMAVLLLGVWVITACGAEAVPTEVPPTSIPPTQIPTKEPFVSPLPTVTLEEGVFESPIGLPNPASQYCEDQGYELEMREEAGGTAGYCLFPDGTECEEWAFYRGECKPGTSEP